MGVGESVVKRREEDRFLLGPDEGVGVETLTEAEEQRNGSSFILDEVTVRWDEETPCDDEDEPTAAGRSSSDGGMIPSSVYKKSIWTIISDSCVIRLLCQNSIKQSALFRKNQITKTHHFTFTTNKLFFQLREPLRCDITFCPWVSTVFTRGQCSLRNIWLKKIRTQRVTEPIQLVCKICELFELRMINLAAIKIKSSDINK